MVFIVAISPSSMQLERRRHLIARERHIRRRTSATRNKRILFLVRQLPCYSTVSDLLPTETSDDRVDSRRNCRPSVRPREVHDLICTDELRAKSPDAYIEHARVSQATKFIEHPAVLSRLSHFLFGVCGFSVLHPRQFDLSPRLKYTSNIQRNVRNFSVKLPHLPKNPSHGDVKAALGVLRSYCDEFFDSHTRQLVFSAGILPKNGVTMSPGRRTR
ncbi:LOW QUALITY PROTEIN: hypothetical protein PHMEG_0004249 [Phytophthora megakarya]|uniref:Uncharacterized protein n=1 Tax=Phytophthora megakarya TaxID=4795 RepID=A0A225WU76_9STRA|nr:LOW QUALITY PROTEIN: hypothetical protein PHMEG_0004249 [Phytophthora megakarya]